ncbi:NmrA family protein [Spongiactinospora rosea]|uniref:NmrA family protein n=1 Tax=Spongiactinospora rosea TaxID=2248750 RepID=A0A366LNW1_9ACTN|nr:NmrA family protein [Spongiactinospora rosea]
MTGASGRIGRWVVRGLVGAGARVRAMSRDPEAARALLPAGVEIVPGDFTRPETWSAALDGVRRVHLFPRVDPEGGFVRRAVEAGTRRFVVHSAVAAGFAEGGTPTSALSPLERHLAHERDWHRGVERSVEATGVEWTHVRPGLPANWALGWADGIRGAGEVRSPHPGSASVVVHEADVAEIAVSALLTDDHFGATYTITGPGPITQAEQVRTIGAALGREIRFVELTPEQARAEWHDPAGGIDDDVLDWLIPLLASPLVDIVPATTTYEEITGRPPRTFAQWAHDNVADFQ